MKLRNAFDIAPLSKTCWTWRKVLDLMPAVMGFQVIA